MAMSERMLLKYALLVQRRRRQLGLDAANQNDLQHRPSKLIVTDHNNPKSLPVAIRAELSGNRDRIKQSATLEAEALKIMRGMK